MIVPGKVAAPTLCMRSEPCKTGEFVTLIGAGGVMPSAVDVAGGVGAAVGTLSTACEARNVEFGTGAGVAITGATPERASICSRPEDKGRTEDGAMTLVGDVVAPICCRMSAAWKLGDFELVEGADKMMLGAATVSTSIWSPVNENGCADAVAANVVTTKVVAIIRNITTYPTVERQN